MCVNPLQFSSRLTVSTTAYNEAHKNLAIRVVFCLYLNPIQGTTIIKSMLKRILTR